MIRGATSKLAAALGLTGGKGGQGREAGESAFSQAGESASRTTESSSANGEAAKSPDKPVVRSAESSAKPKRRTLAARVHKGDTMLLRGFMVWLNANDIAGEIRACDLWRCHREFSQETGADPLSPRQLALALGAHGLKKRRLRVRDRASGRVAKLASGAPVRATRYLIEHLQAIALPSETACADQLAADLQSTETGASATIGKAA